MWIKFLLSGLIIAFCVFLGYLAAGKHRARMKFYAQFFAFNERYLAELLYARKPLSDFMREYEYTGDFEKVLNSFASQREYTKLHYLTQEENKECSDYFAALGKGDSLSQKNFFASRKQILEEKKSASEKEAKQRSELYLKLGLLGGLAFVILIV